MIDGCCFLAVGDAVALVSACGAAECVLAAGMKAVESRRGGTGGFGCHGLARALLDFSLWCTAANRLDHHDEMNEHHTKPFIADFACVGKQLVIGEFHWYKPQ